MQVLQLTPEQIAMLPPEQRQSILILKEQIQKTAGGAPWRSNRGEKTPKRFQVGQDEVFYITTVSIPAGNSLKHSCIVMFQCCKFWHTWLFSFFLQDSNCSTSSPSTWTDLKTSHEFGILSSLFVFFNHVVCFLWQSEAGARGLKNKVVNAEQKE